MTFRLEFLHDPSAFLDAAGDRLAERPLESTVVASVTGRLLETGVAADGPAPVWWLVVRDRAGAVVGAGMRTAPFPPFPVYLLPMPEEAALALARALHERGEEVAAVYGALPAVAVVSDELARLTGARTRVAEHMRLHRLGTLAPPSRVPAGALRRAEPGDVDLVLSWFDAFAADAAEQAGSPHAHPTPIETRESVARRIAGGEVWLWVDEGVPVHVTAFNPPSYGVARVGPVYTPKVHRGRGYAAVAVAEVSRMLLEAGHEVCLFTDLANPTSNALYERLGYQTVVDMANVVIEPGTREDGSCDPTST